MNFKRIAAGLVACTMSMTLFGCELVSVNQDRDNAQVIFSVGDRNYTKEMLNVTVNTVFGNYGFTDVNSKEYDEYRVQIVEKMAEEKSFNHYAVANGYMDKLTEEDKKAVDKSFEEEKKRYNDGLKDSGSNGLVYTSEGGQMNVNGAEVGNTAETAEVSEAEKEKADKETQKKQRDYLLQNAINNIDEYKQVLLEEKAAELLTKNIENAVTVSDQDVQAKYKELLGKQKSSFNEKPKEYMTAVQNESETVVYTPAGFRKVKNLLIKFDDETTTKLKALESEVGAMEDGEAKTAKQAELDAFKKQAYGKIEAKAKEVLAKVKGGTNFDTLIEKYGEDEGAKTNKDGYLVHANVTDQYVANFQTAAMALGKVGDTSELVETEFGYHILMYASDVKSAETPFEQVKTKLKEETLTEKKEKAVSSKKTEVYDKYKSDGTIKIYLDRIKVASVPGKK